MNGYGRCISNMLSVDTALVDFCQAQALYYGRFTSMETSTQTTCIISLSLREAFSLIERLIRSKFNSCTKEFGRKNELKMIVDIFNVNKTCRLPWNTKTPLGYLGELLFGISICEVYMASTGVIILTFVSLCLYHRAFYRIFKFSLEKLGDSVNESDQKKLLCDLIRLHNTAKG